MHAARAVRRHPALCLAPLLAPILTCHLGVSAEGQPVSVLDAHVLSRDLTAWVEAIAAHEPGAADLAAQHTAALDATHLRDIFRELDGTIHVLQRASKRNRPIPVRGTRSDGRLMSTLQTRELLGVSASQFADGDLTSVIERAVLLHTDVAIHLYERHPTVIARAVPSGGAGSVLVRDGLPIGMAVRWPHWQLSRELIARLRQERPDAPEVEQWFVGVAAYMYAHLNLMDLVPHLREAVRTLPDAPQVLFQVGLMHALMASPGVQHGARQAATLPNQKLDVVAARTHLRQARSHYARVISADPGHAEARVRLAHVLLTMRDAREARMHLEAALDGPLDGPLRYYAELFLGNALAAQGDHQSAGEAYRRSGALFPDAQSPPLALSRLARSAGRQVQALEMLDLMLVPRQEADDRSDPWWRFYRRHEDNPEYLLTEWRTDVGQRSTQP